MIKRILYLIIIMIVCSFLIDYFLVMHLDKKALFIIKNNNDTKYGLIYKIKEDSDKVEFYVLKYKIKEKNKASNTNFEIIDKSGENCIDGIYYFYQDDEYKYYFTCQKDYYIKINTIEYSLKNALENNLISIKDLENSNIKIGKTPL